MTSQEIRTYIERWHLTQAGANPLWEIAYQLAVMNERPQNRLCWTPEGPIASKEPKAE